MFIYINVDLLGLYKPGTVEGILKGKVFTFDITQTFMVGALAASAVPIMMIVLSTALPARAQSSDEPRRRLPAHPLDGVQPGRRDVAGLPRSRVRPRAGPPRVHHPLGLDLARHAGDPLA